MRSTSVPEGATAGSEEPITPVDRARRLLATYLPRGAVILAILTFAGYVAGLVRDRAFARAYGAGGDLDAYNAAFVLPELALDVLVAGGLIAPFVPLFTGLRDDSAEAAHAFARTVLTFAALVMIVASALLFVLAPATTSFIVPGFTGAQRDLYVSLFRLMCVTPVIFAISIVLGEILVAERRFVTYALAPLLYNGGIAAGTLLFSGRFGIYAAAGGALAGAVAHLAIRLVGVLRTSFRPRLSFRLRTKGFGEFCRLMVPKMASQPIEPLTFLYFTALASTLEPGSLSSLNYARNFEGVLVSLVGISFAVAAFPTLSAQFARGDRRGFLRTFGTTLGSISAITIAGSVVLFFVSSLVIRILLGGGAFDAVAVARTAGILSVFAVAVPFESVTQVLSRALYATRTTLLPSAAAVAGFIATVIVAQSLAPRLGLTAIPASYAAGMVVRVAIMTGALIPRLAGMGHSSVRWGGRVRPARRRLASSPTLAGAFLIVLAAGALVAANQAVSSGASLTVVPDVTPWARVNAPSPTASPVVPSASLPAISVASPATGSPIPTLSPSPTPTLGPFSMDLYTKGDYVGELEDTWCVAAAMQTSMNIMNTKPDVTRATQARLEALAEQLSASPTGGAEPEGWAKGLTALGYGSYAVSVQPSVTAAIHLAAKQVRLTGRPAGLLVWYGAHSWVMSGFSATADPAQTDAFTVTSVRIEDVWYNRFSTIWGYSRPPDADVPVAKLPRDFLPWRMKGSYPDKAWKYVIVIPTL